MHVSALFNTANYQDLINPYFCFYNNLSNLIVNYTNNPDPLVTILTPNLSANPKRNATLTAA